MIRFLVTILIFKWQSVLCRNDNNIKCQNSNFLEDPRSVNIGHDQEMTTIPDKCYVVKDVAKLDSNRSENAADKRKISRISLLKSDVRTNATENTSTAVNQTSVNLILIKNNDTF